MTLNEQYDQFRAQNKRTGHNLGFQRYFTSAPGMILPIDHRIMSPSETIQWSVNINTITQPLLRPAMLDVVQKVDCFFVPLTMLYTGFPQTFFQTNDYLTSAMSPDDANELPLFDINDLCDSVDDFNGDVLDSPVDLNRFDSELFGAYRLCMMLGLNPNQFFSDANFFTSVNPSALMRYSFFPYQLCAYQAIYQNWFRDDDREERNLMSYQLDYTRSRGVPPVRDTSWLRLHYHQRERDYFSSLRVSPIMSTLNLADGFDSADVLSRVNGYLSENGARPDSYDDEGAVNSKRFTQFSQRGPDPDTTGALRSLFAVEKFNRIMGRARKNYDSQVMAHFGFDVPRDIKHEISFLGSFSGNIGISTVMSNAATEQAELGERAGSGNGKLGGKPIKFTAPCHGVFMAVYYSVPRFSYPEGFVFDKKNQITNRLDFPIPEYDRLGDQPLYGFESFSNVRRFENSGNALSDDAVRELYNLPLGWQRRYEQFKRNYSRHSLAFYRPQSYEGVNVWSPWILSGLPYESLEIDGEISEETPNPYTHLNDVTPNFESFLVSPKCLNDLFVMQYKTTGFTDDDIKHPWLLFQRDPFMHAATINSKLVSFMSVTGEPSLDSMF